MTEPLRKRRRPRAWSSTRNLAPRIDWVGTAVRGLAVHVATRVIAVAIPGDVMVSAATAELAEGSDLAVAGRDGLLGH
jgi:class 3 adenylate cyclase